MQRASRGDALAVDELLVRNLPELRDFVARRMGRALQQKESASDLVVSACREVLGHMDRFHYAGEESFRRWLYASALRKIKDRHRFWQAERRRAEREEAAGGAENSEERSRRERFFRTLTTPSQEAIAREELERIEGAFARLPEKYREVILLHHVDGLSHAAIAAELGIRESYARLLLSRGLARIARLLERR